MNDKQFMEIARAAMSDADPLTVTIRIKDAWMLVSALQLATRHPRFPFSMKQAVIEIGKQFQSAIVERHPEALEALEMGWYKNHDRR